ncbi:hypothetical protein DEU56DRAFT_753977 [Suillus clintonianus]|uniref:uncharacterized protein n=1 Tax=Suillus clintonianus TaxID=1904413 RepID=UPI001B87038C|nr:uncharacterized protein DEU56DRAFT_753977 [Suillus clintonianus]KAG2145927.1 hypothetical protein DEU56DRAFT_753977 [Suillus clintonianus]
MDRLKPVFLPVFHFLQKLGNCNWTFLDLRQLATEVRHIDVRKFYLGDYIFQQGNYGETHQLISQSQYIPTCCSILSHLDDQILDDLSESEGIITEPGRLYHMLFLVCEHVKHIHVDDLVKYLDLKDFIDDFNTQNNAQITLAGVIMVIDAGFFAVQGVSTGLVAESMLKGSIIFCVGCLFVGMFAQHFSEKLKSLQFALLMGRGNSLPISNSVHALAKGVCG